MSVSLPSANALIDHADDPRHIIYVSWVIPHFFPYMRGLLKELVNQPAQATFAQGLLEFVFSQPTSSGCHCLTLTANLRATFKAYGEMRVSIRDNQAWTAVSVAMIYFILTTDFHFAAPMSAHMKASHLAQLGMLNFQGPKFPDQFLQ
ncbi:hypothetical protein B0F90DRAFT_1815634 [Multifurca ochricompacta]|uniref:Uncharacterized protein n=1 Tax=Multifurca ochricompacta TaxID=376703 RepID=A0AAD4QQ00_9AGAM|nr:hypothetical protein B0F90DRAFT_1815634 [Multifurca ochricompacta]